jgi:protein SCO1/2
MLAVVAAAGLGGPAAAELSQADLARVGVHVPADAAEPLSLAFQDADGRPTTLGVAVAGRPTLLVFEDFRCKTLCGPALAIAAISIGRSGLVPGRDLRLVSIGLNPHETPADARAFRDAHLAGQPPLRATTAFLTGDAGVVARATAAVGYGYAYDASVDQFVHPVAAFMLAPDGRVVRTLEQTAFDPADLRAAVADARADRAGDLVDRLALLCHGLWPAAGRYDGAVQTALRASALAGVAAIAGGLLLLIRRRRAA